MNEHGYYKTALIIENDPNPDEFISDYIQNILTGPEWEFDFLTNLSKQSEKTIQQKLSENNTYIFSTTFNNKGQNEKIIQMIGAQEEPKNIYIHYLSGDLFFGLDKALPDNFSPKESGFDKHTIYGIHRETKEKPSGTFFRKLLNYFDTIEYYWNDDIKGYYPERPNCFFKTNLEPIYKYKPIWINKESDIKE